MTSLSHAELTAALQAPAFIHEDEIGVLCKYALRLSAYDSITEIGCAWGGSTLLFLLSLPMNGVLLSVDPFVQDSMDTWRATESACRTAVLHGLHAFDHAWVYDDWHLCAETSAAAAEHYQDEINLLYIDGAHDEFNVNQDFALWTQHLIKGGFLLLHDSRREDGYPDDVFARGWRFPTELANRLRTDTGWKLLDEAYSLTVWEKA